MTRLIKLIAPAFLIVTLFVACEDKMDEVQNDMQLEQRGEYIPPKDRIKLPPGYDKTITSETTSSDK